MLALKGEAGRASPETVAWPCDRCLSLGPVENEGTMLNLCSQATLKKKGNKEPERSYLWVILARWDNDWPFVKPHMVLSCVHLCFTLANSQRELITAFLTAGVGERGFDFTAGTWRALTILELLLHYAADTLFQSKGKLTFQVEVPGEKCLAFPAKDVSSGSQTQQGPSLFFFPTSWPQTQMVWRRKGRHTLMWPISQLRGNKDFFQFTVRSCSACYLWSVECKRSSVNLLHEKNLYSNSLKNLIFFFFFFLQFCLFILGCAESSLLGTVLQLPRAGTTF